MIRRQLLFLLFAGAAFMLGCNSDAKSDTGSAKDGASQQKQATASSGNNQKGGDNASAPVDSVKITPDQQRQAGIAVATVTVRSVPRSLSVAGQVGMDERHTNHIGAIADGRVEQVFVLPGDVVRAGQTLATIHSHTVHETVGALVQAYAALQRQTAAVDFATQNRERYARLLQIQAASVEESQRADQQLKQAQQDYKDADATVRMEREHLSELLQVPPSTLTVDHLYDRELVPVRAVAAGVVVARRISPGQVVSTGDEAFAVTNLSTVWVTAAVNEKDLPRIRAGDAARISLQGGPEEALRGTVTMLGDVLDPQTRTVPVRIAVPNSHTALRPGMFVTTEIGEARSQQAVFVPEGAIQEVNGMQAVFTTADGQTFRIQAVTTAAPTGGMVQVREGLQPGERVVVQGAFMVKSELLKGSVGEG